MPWKRRRDHYPHIWRLTPKASKRKGGLPSSWEVHYDLEDEVGDDGTKSLYVGDVHKVGDRYYVDIKERVGPRDLEVAKRRMEQRGYIVVETSHNSPSAARTIMAGVSGAVLQVGASLLGGPPDQPAVFGAGLLGGLVGEAVWPESHVLDGFTDAGAALLARFVTQQVMGE